jgi:hypothetical protein
MPHPHEHIKALPYYWEYVKRFGKESWGTLRRDFLVSAIVAVLTVLLRHEDRTVVQGAILFLEATFVAFSAFALRHLIHVSLILHRERYNPEDGGIQIISNAYGAWGIVLLLGMSAGISDVAYELLLHKMATIAVTLPAPNPPIITQVMSPPESNSTRETRTPKSPAQTITSQPTTPSLATQAPPQTQATPTTFLDRVVQENRGLTAGDRNRLSDELYAADEFLKQSRSIGYKLNREFGQLNNDRQSGALAKNVEDHVKFFKDLDAAGWDQYHGLQKFQSDYQYFSDQTEYIFGDNPFNAGEGLLLNAIEGMRDQLTSWSKITNRDQQDILSLEARFQSDYETDLRHFFDWVNVSLQRITQMRQSLEPNGVVQPLPTNTVAPAPAMNGVFPRLSS